MGIADLPAGQEVSAASAHSAAQAVIAATVMIGPRQRRANQRHKTVLQSPWGQFSVRLLCRRIMTEEKKKTSVELLSFLAVVTATLP